ncbi:TPA: TIGR04076 family protein [Candidatus Bathyarchaeota archaeon]|nr:TIGR04076 family protein [Candidatus Bathyarchaeota archaeon]
MLEIEVYEIRGRCPVHRAGDKIVIDGPNLLLEKTDAVCIHALSSLLHYVLALDRGVDPVDLGLTRPKDRRHAYIQCVDPGEPYTGGGTVIFRCRRISK